MLQRHNHTTYTHTFKIQKYHLFILHNFSWMHIISGITIWCWIISWCSLPWGRLFSCSQHFKVVLRCLSTVEGMWASMLVCPLTSMFFRSYLHSYVDETWKYITYIYFHILQCWKVMSHVYWWYLLLWFNYLHPRNLFYLFYHLL